MSLSTITNNNIVATLVKRFLQFSPTPMIPSNFYDEVLDLDGMYIIFSHILTFLFYFLDETDETRRLEQLLHYVDQFPKENFLYFLICLFFFFFFQALLVVFLNHIKVMLQYTAKTSMGISNFATIFAPCIFRKEGDEG
jgi:hypothetical protein